MTTIHNGRGCGDVGGFDPLTGAYHCQHDWSGPERLSQTVAEVVLALVGEEPAAGPPLAETIDPDALDQLFDSTGGNEEATSHLTFTHLDCAITVYRDGHVVAYPPDDAAYAPRRSTPR